MNEDVKSESERIGTLKPENFQHWEYKPEKDYQLLRMAVTPPVKYEVTTNKNVLRGSRKTIWFARFALIHNQDIQEGKWRRANGNRNFAV